LGVLVAIKNDAVAEDVALVGSGVKNFIFDDLRALGVVGDENPLAAVLLNEIVFDDDVAAALDLDAAAPAGDLQSFE
jgi:hypothetical protein